VLLCRYAMYAVTITKLELLRTNNRYLARTGIKGLLT
jgi:hypothetical protein